MRFVALPLVLVFAFAAPVLAHGPNPVASAPAITGGLDFTTYAGLAFVAPVLAQDSIPPDPIPAPASDPGTGGDWNFTSYSGLALFGFFAVGMLKGFWPDWAKGKEPIVAIVLTVLAGIVVKLTGIAFPTPADTTDAAAWVAHVSALIAAGMGSGLIHDKIANPALKKNGKGAG